MNILAEQTVGGTGLRTLQDDRARRDAAAWDALLAQLPAGLRQAAQAAARELTQTERALDDARAQLADLDAHRPSKAGDVPKWAARRGEVAGIISAYEQMATGARQSYEQAARAALTAAQQLTAEQARRAEQAHPQAEVEYRRRKEAARQYLADANETRDVAGRLQSKVNSGNLDLFR